MAADDLLVRALEFADVSWLRFACVQRIAKCDALRHAIIARVCGACMRTLVIGGHPSIRLSCDHLMHVACVPSAWFASREAYCPWCASLRALPHAETVPWCVDFTGAKRVFWSSESNEGMVYASTMMTAPMQHLSFSSTHVHEVLKPLVTFESLMAFSFPHLAFALGANKVLYAVVDYSQHTLCKRDRPAPGPSMYRNTLRGAFGDSEPFVVIGRLCRECVDQFSTERIGPFTVITARRANTQHVAYKVIVLCIRNYVPLFLETHRVLFS